MATDWHEKARFMRDVHAVSAMWGSEGELISLTLGPEPMPSNSTATQKKPVPNEDELRAERRRVTLASSSRLIPVGRVKQG